MIPTQTYPKLIVTLSCYESHVEAETGPCRQIVGHFNSHWRSRSQEWEFFCSCLSFMSAQSEAVNHANPPLGLPSHPYLSTPKPSHATTRLPV